jgi:hypothetical protein
MPTTNDDNNNQFAEESAEKLEHRTKIFVDEANQVFIRFLSDFDSLTKKIVTHFQIFLVLISIESTVILALIRNGEKFSYWEITLLIVIILLSFSSFLILLYLVHPKIIKDVKIFEDGRFDELLMAPPQELLSDYLLQMKKAYDHDVQIYKKIGWWFYLVFYLIAITTICFIVFIGIVLFHNFV